MLDEAKRKFNDEHYDWWSAEGDYKLIGFHIPCHREVTIAIRWHEFFLWKPIAEKVHPIPSFGERTDKRAYQWNKYAFERAFFEEDSTFYSGWGKGAESEDDFVLVKNLEGYTILFERAIQSPYMQELGVLQSECKELVCDLYERSSELLEVELKLMSILPIGKSKARQQKQKLDDEIARVGTRINQILARVNKIRAVVLGE